MNVPDDLRFAKSHEWVRLAGDEATVGISDHAQEELTDIVYVELPKIGTEATAGETICVVESVKAASDIYAPVCGTVIAVNDALSGNPALANSDPYGDGWIFLVKLAASSGAEDLLTPEQYRTQLGG